MRKPGLGTAMESDIEVLVREKGETTFTFFLNRSDSEIDIDLEGRKGFDLISDRKVEGSLTLQGLDVAVVENLR